MSKRKSALVALIAGPIVGALVPFIQVEIECRRPVSEACVWGKALLPVSVTVSIVFIGALAALAIFFMLEWRRRRGEKEGE